MTQRRTAPPAPPATNDLLAQLARSRPPVAEPAAGMTEETKAEREVLLDSILREILADSEAAFRTVAVLYQDFLVRCRIKRVAGEPPNLPAFRRRLAVARAGVDAETAAGSEWGRAMTFAADLAEDIQGVYLLLARAAMAGIPCPPDGEIARSCGSRSPGRARRLVAYLESRNLVVTRNDPRGLRIIALPDLGWETGPGDPNAYEEPVAVARPGSLRRRLGSSFRLHDCKSGLASRGLAYARPQLTFLSTRRKSAMKLTGIHHLTAVSADAPGNHAFYTQALGMRLVKKTRQSGRCERLSPVLCRRRWRPPAPTSHFSTCRPAASGAAPTASPAPPCAFAGRALCNGGSDRL